MRCRHCGSATPDKYCRWIAPPDVIDAAPPCVAWLYDDDPAAAIVKTIPMVLLGIALVILLLAVLASVR